MSEFQKPTGTVFSGSELTSSALSKILCRTVWLIQEVERHGVELERYDDWWQHDGLHFYRSSMKIHELFAIVRSPRSLLSATPEENYVRVGITSHHHDWYLRFRLGWDDDGFELKGSFDMVLPSSLDLRFEIDVLAWANIEAHKQNSVEFYASIIQE